MSKKLLDSSTELKFENTKEVEKQLLDLYDELRSDIEKMQKIDTSNVKPMTRVDNSPITFLREDVVKEESLTKEQLLSNAPSSNEDFIIINNGGSHD